MRDWDDQDIAEQQEQDLPDEILLDKHYDRLLEMVDERKVAFKLLAKALGSDCQLPESLQEEILELLQRMITAQHRYNHGRPPGEGRAVMPTINGRSFRCRCGANVFTAYDSDPDRYFCNGCSAEYVGE